MAEITHNSPFKSYREKYNFFCRRCPALDTFKEAVLKPSDPGGQTPARVAIHCIVHYPSSGPSVDFVTERGFATTKDKFFGQDECPVVRTMRMHQGDVLTRFDWAIRLINEHG